ncbi:RTA1 like protein-domain-containing protein [Aspergillus avenaceus]|uniref:RTA1 like protein-domain-containing protein n=1 Tax=Aspergillus avenaceus TaxID=36643 RepID=A0A5N6U8Y9_ASPAV|nr:RTA1 like protein-domain-containing protein [Aspergillus avenaceus]
MAETKQYPYDPDQSVPIFFAVVFGISAILTTFQYFWKRCWYWFPMVIAALMEAIGYICRSYSAHHQYNEGSFDAQYLLIFLGPTVMAAACYMTLSRIILHATRPEHITRRTLWITPRFMTPIFVTCDIIAIIIQLIGGVCAISHTESTVKLGYNIAKAGLVVQLVTFGFFTVLSFRFFFTTRDSSIVFSDDRWRRLLVVVNFACVLIFVRSVYRLIEFCEGDDGYLNAHEWNYYVFEAAVIVPAVAVFNIVHPADYLQNVRWRHVKNRPSIGSEVELEGA